jgi:two-component system response regulator RpaA
MRNKAVFTTGEAAEVCRLSQQTIIRCFDNGQLEGFRVPGSKFRRIPRASLLKFMKDNGIPLDAIGDDEIRVLVVDDEPEILKLFEAVLGSDSRFEVKTAGTGYEAGMLTQQLRPDVVVLDLRLPDVDGNVVCRTIRENPELAQTHIIMISGAMGDEEERDLLAAGADACFHKPLDMNAFTESILKLVKS